MSRPRPARLAALLLLPAAAVAAPRALTLDEAYRLALKRSESLAAIAASAGEAAARVDELAAAAMPKLSLKASELILEEPSAGRDDDGRRDRPEIKVNLRQPLFSGFREHAVIRAGRSLSRAAALEEERARQSLFVDVARACLDLARLQRESATRESVLSLTRDRLKEIQHREKLGRSRRGERLSVAALVADLEALRAEESRQERQAQRLVRFLTGLEEDVEIGVPAPPALPSLEETLKSAEARPDVRARAEELEAARHSLAAARREAWPTVDVDANHYLKRSGSQEDVDWDVLFSASLPLHTGGAWSARREQARRRLASAQAGRDLASRAAALEVRAVHDELSTLLEEIPLRERAGELAESNAKVQAEDYRLGLVTNLDVLNALQSLQEARFSLDEARLEAVLAGVRLKAAAGTLTEAP